MLLLRFLAFGTKINLTVLTQYGWRCKWVEANDDKAYRGWSAGASWGALSTAAGIAVGGDFFGKIVVQVMLCSRPSSEFGTVAAYLRLTY